MEEKLMSEAIDKTAEALKELQPVSIVLMGSFARGEWHPVSDAEIGVIFEDTNYHSRSTLKKYATERVRVYPFRLSELLALTSVIPFPRRSYFWWLKHTAKTLWGRDILSGLEVQMTLADWREEITFQRGVALSAFISFRNKETQTANWAFSKSCLFATVAALGLRGKEIYSFGAAVEAASSEFRDFAAHIKKAHSVWRGGASVEEVDIFKNFEYFSMLEQV